MPKMYYWLKLQTDFFDNKVTKKLRSIAGGDTYVIIYLKMMLKSINNGGCLYIDGIEDTPAEEIALEIDENPDNVEVTINFLQRHGLIEIREDSVYLPEAEQATGKETDKAQLMRNHREKLKNGNNVTVESNNVTASLPTVTQSRVRVDKELDKSESRVVVDTYGTFKNVRLTTDEYKKLSEHCGEYLDTYINTVSTYRNNHPESVTFNDATTISKWYDSDKMKNKLPQIQRAGSFDTDEFFEMAVSRSYSNVQEDAYNALMD